MQNFNFTVFEDFCLSLSWKYRFLQNVNHAKVQSKTNKYCKFHVDLTRRRLSKNRFKKLGMVLKKLYRNTLSPRFMLLTVKIPCVYSKTSCMPDTFRKVCARVCCRSSKSWPTEIINPGLGRQITRYHIKWFFLVFLYLFSIHQKNMYMPSTAAPKPCPTLVQNAGPKIWTIFRQKWQKKSLTLLGGTHLFSRTTEANRLPNNILLC